MTQHKITSTSSNSRRLLSGTRQPFSNQGDGIREVKAKPNKPWWERWQLSLLKHGNFAVTPLSAESVRNNHPLGAERFQLSSLLAAVPCVNVQSRWSRGNSPVPPVAALNAIQLKSLLLLTLSSPLELERSFLGQARTKGVNQKGC